VRAGTLLQYGSGVDGKLAALRRGMLEPAVLASVERRARYAGEIASVLREAGFAVQDGTLHPLLNRLRREGLVDPEWRESPAGPPRKYLTLSATGREQLAVFRDHLRELSSKLDTMGVE
jgi:PadR family transcriptional regulator, regulatory protein PadR